MYEDDEDEPAPCASCGEYPCLESCGACDYPPACPECERSHGPHYRGPCEH